MLRAIALLCCTSCGGPDFMIGATRFYYATDEGTDLWQDLPEAMGDMQALAEVPADVWDATVWLYPAGEPTRLGPHQACFYDQYGGFEVRVTDADQPTHMGCLPHEFAHRWHQLVVGTSTSNEAAHNPEWERMFRVLEEPTLRTWLARRLQQP